MTNQIEFDGEIVSTSDPAAAAALWELYKQPRHRRQRLPIHCAQQHRGRMYLQLRDNQLWACHYPGQGSSRCATAIGGQGPGHKAAKEYLARSAYKAGFTVTEEFTTGRGTRLDLCVSAPFTFGIEAQLSDITDRKVKERTTKSTRAGYPPIWFATESRIFPAPNIGYNRGVDWQKGVPPPGTIPALHMKTIVAERCTPSSRFEVCPDTRRGITCGKWHPFPEPLRHWTIDQAIAGIGELRLSILQTKTKNVLIVPAADLTVYRELTGHDGNFTPGGHVQPSPATDDDDNHECRAVRAVEYDEHCNLCGSPLLLIAPGRNICERCRIDNELSHRAIQLRLWSLTA